jgi:hypothetical protein
MNLGALVTTAIRILDPDARVTDAEPACERPGERLTERTEHARARAGRKRRAPVLDLKAVEAIGVTIPERVSGALELGGQLALRRWIDGRAVTIEEQVEQRIDGLRAMLDGQRRARALRVPQLRRWRSPRRPAPRA